MRRVLMVAFHFPPLAGSSGIQRTLRFVQHLPQFEWMPMVLSAHVRAYERTSDDQMDEVPSSTTVVRAQAWDAARHFAVAGRYPRALARPDRWSSWRYHAVQVGMRLIERFRPSVLWSTYPIATAHSIAATLQRRSGLPWIADFRDPMAQDDYPADRTTREAYWALESRVAAAASALTVTTPGVQRLMMSRYPALAHRVALVENGYDEPSFAAAEQLVRQRKGPAIGRATLLHSGIVYPSERDPTQLFEAVAQLHRLGHIRPGEFVLRFRAPVHEAFLQLLAQQHGISSLVDIQPPLPYVEALAEMMQADHLLLMQATNCNDQVPAKLYEYLRAGRPIIALTDAAGDTAAVLARAGVADRAALNDAQGIFSLILASLRGQRLQLRASSYAASQASRLGRASELAQLLGSVDLDRARTIANVV